MKKRVSEEEDEEGEEDEDLNDETSDSADVYEEAVWKSELRAKLDRKDVSAVWFRNHREGDSYFDFNRLDSVGIPHYTPPAEGITFISVNN